MTERGSGAAQDWTPTIEPYKPARVRYLLAFVVLGVLVLDLALVFALVFVHTLLPSEVDAFTAALLVPIIGLAGPVMGFYFGSNSDE
jgi:carbon starvation protein CstA